MTHLRQRRQANKSNSNAVTDEDDWTKFTDQTARKRAQNRIAQRNYRRKLKSRIEALEQTATANKPSTHTNGENSGRTSCGQGDHSCAKHPTRSNGRVLSPSHVQSSPTYHVQPSELSDHEMTALHTTDQPSIRRPPPIQQSQENPSQMLNPQTLTESEYMFPSFSKSPDYCDAFTLSSVGDLVQNGSVESENPISASRPGGKTCDERLSGLKAMSDNCNQSHRDESFGVPFGGLDWYTRIGPESPFASKNTPHHPIGSSTAAPHQIKTPQTLTNAGCQHCHSSFAPYGRSLDETTAKSMNSPLSLAIDVRAGGGDNSSPSSSDDELPETATLDERLEYVLESVRFAGFRDFDTVVSKYYTADIQNSTLVANARRFSRNRHLPRILADLRENAESWTDWEAQGYRDEILKSAESILASEYNSYVRSTQFQDAISSTTQDENLRITSLPNTPLTDKSSGKGMSQTVFRLKNTFQEKLPNLWALATTLTMDGLALRQRDQSNLVLAAVSTLCLSRKMTVNQLRLWVDYCLDDQNGYHKRSITRPTP